MTNRPLEASLHIQQSLRCPALSIGHSDAKIDRCNNSRIGMQKYRLQFYLQTIQIWILFELSLDLEI